MRLTCPNCGAQYEVPDQVIPIDGRGAAAVNLGGDDRYLRRSGIVRSCARLAEVINRRTGDGEVTTGARAETITRPMPG